MDDDMLGQTVSRRVRPGLPSGFGGRDQMEFLGALR